jgi:hypothetical protein
MNRREISGISRQELCCVWINIFRRCKASLEAGGFDTYDSSMKWGKYNCRENVDYKLPAEAALVCDKTPMTVVMLRLQIKHALSR